MQTEGFFWSRERALCIPSAGTTGTSMCFWLLWESCFTNFFFNSNWLSEYHTLYSRVPAPLPTPLSSFMVFDSSIFFFGEGVAKGGGQMHLFSDSIIQCWVLSLLSPEFWPTGQVLPPFFFPSLPSQKSKKTLRCPVMFYFSWSSCWQHSKPVHQWQTGTWQDC